MSANDGKNNFALVPKTPAALEKAEPGTKRVLSGMVTDALALVKKQRRSKPRIVIVNDWPEPIQLLESLIRDWFEGATILTFQKGDEAWQELQREDPNILITDMMRQEDDSMDGWTMIPLLAEKNVKYPIVVVSGLPENAAKNYAEKGKPISATFRELLQQARQTLNIAALAIPFENKELRKVLEACLEHRSFPTAGPKEFPQTTQTLTREFELKWRFGARTAALIAKVASAFVSSILISRDEEVADAKKIMELMMLSSDSSKVAVILNENPNFDFSTQDIADIGCGCRVKVSADGTDATAAINALTELFTCGSRVERCVEPGCSSRPALGGYTKDYISYGCKKGHDWDVPRSDKP